MVDLLFSFSFFCLWYLSLFSLSIAYGETTGARFTRWLDQQRKTHYIDTKSTQHTGKNFVHFIFISEALLRKNPNYRNVLIMSAKLYSSLSQYTLSLWSCYIFLDYITLHWPFCPSWRDFQPSFGKVIPPTFHELGLGDLVSLYSELCQLGKPPVIVDAAELQQDPEVIQRSEQCCFLLMCFSSVYGFHAHLFCSHM